LEIGFDSQDFIQVYFEKKANKELKYSYNIYVAF